MNFLLQQIEEKLNRKEQFSKIFMRQQYSTSVSLFQLRFVLPEMQLQS